eukprot:TRINITY_DN36596_c0_g1_i1.p1 TRINITY_DN36596_c0_g1~~TRINITY_DN36596_c0_g1_i1.p1  ORF type:complete len:573 (+),score=67.66 TRINITY_DN36596_c0_g1_i1:70-1788(+)
MHEDLYSILNLTPNASADEVKAAYKQAALKHHPDKGGSCDKFKLVAHAFETLFCPSARAKYDAKFSRRTRPQCGPSRRNGAAKDVHSTSSRKSSTRKERQFVSTHVGGEGRAPSRRKKTPEAILLRFLVRLAFRIKALVKPSRRAVFDHMSASLKARLSAFMQSEEWDFAQRHPHFFRRAPSHRPTRAATEKEHPMEEEGIIPGLADMVSPTDQVDDGEETVLLPVTNGDSNHRELVVEGMQRLDSEMPVHAAKIKSGFAAKPSKTQVTVYPGIYMRRGQRHDHYVSSIGLENFTIFSRNVPTLEEAVNYHISLMQVKRAFENCTTQSPQMLFADRLKKALEESPPLSELKPSFYTILTHSPTFGTKKVRSPATIDLCEALEHHQLLISGRRTSSDALRAAWVTVLQSERVVKEGSRGNAIKRPLSKQEAEAVAEAAHHRAAAYKEACARKNEARSRLKFQRAAKALRVMMQRRGKRKLDDAEIASRRLRHVLKLIARTERLHTIASRRTAEKAQKLKHQEERQRRIELSNHKKALSVERRLAAAKRRKLNEWLKDSRAMTFEEMRRGPPRL